MLQQQLNNSTGHAFQPHQPPSSNSHNNTSHSSNYGSHSMCTIVCR